MVPSRSSAATPPLERPCAPRKCRWLWAQRRAAAGPSPRDHKTVPQEGALESARKGTSHGPYCYRSGQCGISDLRPRTRRQDHRRATSQDGKVRQLPQERPPSRVVLETSSEAFGLPTPLGSSDTRYELCRYTGAIPGVGARGVKTDRRDVRVLSEVSSRIDLPSVHIPSETSRSWKSTCTAREALVSSRTLLINSARGWLRQRLIKLNIGGVTTFVERARKAQAPLASNAPASRRLDRLESDGRWYKPRGASDAAAKTTPSLRGSSKSRSVAERKSPLRRRF